MATDGELAAYHEAGHALVAHRLGRRVESISSAFVGGVTRIEPLDRPMTDADLETMLAIVFAGEVAQEYA